MRRITLMAALIALAFTHTAQAQPTCREADITSDGTVTSPDFTALAICFGQDVDVPLPQGQFVGYAPGWFDNISGVTRNHECRSNFGPTAHWCASLELQDADPLIFPAEQLPGFGATKVAVSATLPIPPAQVDWVTGRNAGDFGSLWYFRTAAGVQIDGTPPQEPETFDGVACCMDVTP